MGLTPELFFETFWNNLIFKTNSTTLCKTDENCFPIFLIHVDCLMINLQIFLIGAHIWVCLLPCDLFSLNVRECNICKIFTPPPDNVIEID